MTTSVVSLAQLPTFLGDTAGGVDHEARTRHRGCYGHDQRQLVLPCTIALHAAVDANAVAANRLDFPCAGYEEFRHSSLRSNARTHNRFPRMQWWHSTTSWGNRTRKLDAAVKNRFRGALCTKLNHSTARATARVEVADRLANYTSRRAA